MSEKALTQKKQCTKLECLDNNIYQIIAKYLEIDGVPCVMEMVHRLDNENLIDNDGRRILMDNLTGYKNELYRDPLTGVYNRRYYEDNIKDLNENSGVAMITIINRFFIYTGLTNTREGLRYNRQCNQKMYKKFR